MNTTEFLQEVSYNLRGLDDDAPAIGSEEATYWLKTANRIRRGLYRDPKQWSSLYEVLDLGTVAVSTEPSFDLDDTFLAPANGAYVLTGDDSNVRHDYELVEPQAATSNRREVFVAGQDPKVLYFSQEIKAGEQVVGGTLYLPAYVLPDDISTTSGTAIVVVEDEDWLAMATAAEIAFNDLTYESKAPDLNAKSNAMYNNITKSNRRGTYNNPRKSPYNVPRISGY